jgi:tellurite resistance protein TerC
VYKGLKKVVPISNHIDKENFFVKRRHITAATFVALVVIEVMDVVFAIDSALILAITSDPF